MDRIHYEEMASSLRGLIKAGELDGKRLYLFGHCNATEELVRLLEEEGFSAAAVLDNNPAKHSLTCLGVEIRPPETILGEPEGRTAVCIAARAYDAMAAQLRRLGYEGNVWKLVEYNSFSEYSLSPETIARRLRRVEQGAALLAKAREQYPRRLKVLCPFSALGDVYYAMAYLPAFLRSRGEVDCAVFVAGRACREVAELFGTCPAQALPQGDLDAMIQAVLYTGAEDVFIAHQDRPYAINLSKALRVKRVPLETLYRCGIFGLPQDARPCRPAAWRAYEGDLEPGRSVILSPYAKSVTQLRPEIWAEIVARCQAKGYVCYTNVAGEERPLPGTRPISPPISQMRPAVERAGIFIGLRSGLCDVIQDAACRKIALYPPYYYSDTRWTAIGMYRLEGWENIVVEESGHTAAPGPLHAAQDVDL